MTPLPGTSVACEPARPGPRRRWPWVPGAVVAAGLFFSLLVPSMCAPREASKRVKSSSNLRQIGVGLRLYADGHDGVLPGDFAGLAVTTDLTPARLAGGAGGVVTAMPGEETGRNAGNRSA